MSATAQCEPSQVAVVVHSALMVLQEIQGDPHPAPPWKYCTPEMRAGTVAGVTAVRDGLSPQENHERWRAALRAQGWTFGKVKDAVRKTHPCLVAWEDLDEGQRAKNVLFAAIVHALTPPTAQRAV